MDIGGFILTSVVGFILILLGYLIWYKKMLFLVAGYNEATFDGDKEKVAKGTGIVLILLGIVTVVLPYFLYWFGNTLVYCLLAIIGIAGIIVVIMTKSKL